MSRTLREDERAALEAGQNQRRRVRHWWRSRAVLLRAESVPVSEVARAVGCSEASVYHWTAAWRRDGAAGVAEGTHPGPAHRRDEAGEGTVEALLVEGDAAGARLRGDRLDGAEARGPSGPSAAGPPRSAPSGARGTAAAGAGSGPRASWGGRTRRTPRTKARVEHVATTVAAGGEVWFGDETPRRAFPPRRAGWARRGQQRVIVVSGRTSRRVVHGALNAATGELVTWGRERRRPDDGAAFVEALGQVRPDVPKRLVWENAPPHHPTPVQAAAAAAPITLAFLPFRAPELMPGEERWRLGTAVVAANRVYATVQEPAERAVAWLGTLSPFDRLL